MRVAIVTLAVGKHFEHSAESLFHSILCRGVPADIDLVTLGAKQCRFGRAVSVELDYSECLMTDATVSPEVIKKLAIFSLDYDRVIYIDADCLCLGDISFLWSEQLGTASLYAVPDIAAPSYHGEAITRIGLRLDRIFNTAVVIFQRMYSPQTWGYEELLTLIRRRQLVSYDGGDQGYLNHYVQNMNLTVGWLPPSYNYCLDPIMPQLLDKDIRILHFSGGNAKPWNHQFPMDDYRVKWMGYWWKHRSLVLQEKLDELEVKHAAPASSPVCDQPVQPVMPALQPDACEAVSTQLRDDTAGTS